MLRHLHSLCYCVDRRIGRMAGPRTGIADEIYGDWFAGGRMVRLWREGRGRSQYNRFKMGDQTRMRCPETRLYFSIRVVKSTERSMFTGWPKVTQCSGHEGRRHISTSCENVSIVQMQAHWFGGYGFKYKNWMRKGFYGTVGKESAYLSPMRVQTRWLSIIIMSNHPTSQYSNNSIVTE